MSATGLITLRRQQRRIEPGTECLAALSVTSGATADLCNKQPALLDQAQGHPQPEQSQGGLVRCDCCWQEQQRLKFSGKPLEPENQEGLVVHAGYLQRATYPLGLVHTDIQGLFREPDLDGNWYQTV